VGGIGGAGGEQGGGGGVGEGPRMNYGSIRAEHFTVNNLYVGLPLPVPNAISQ
jgi:hypothetical protein